MYTYKRFRTPKSAVTVILIALALVAWGVLGLTGTLLAKKGGGGKASFDVELDLEDSDGNPVIFDESTSGSGTAQWPNLSPSFWGYNDFIWVGGVRVDLIGIPLYIKHGDIVWAEVFFKDDEGIGYKGETEVTDVNGEPMPMPPLPDEGGSFTVQIRKPVHVFKSVGKRGGEGKKEKFLGTVYIGDAVYTRIK